MAEFTQIRTDELKAAVLEPLAGLSGPFLTVSIDATRTDPSAEHEVALRWRALSERVPAGTFPAEVLGDVAAHAVAVTGSAGPATRFLVATAAGLVIDLVLPGRPVRDEAVFGPAPHLLPVLRAVRLRVPYLLVRLDRAGADIDSVPLFGAGVEHVEVQGSNDELHRVSGGLMSGRKIQARVEDSWERNAGEVARVLDELVRDERPALILVSGDPIAESALLREASDAVRERIVRLSTGGRSDGISAAALAQAVDDALAAHRHQARAQIIDRFRQAEARQTLAVQGLGDVVEALGRAQTDHLLLHDDPLSDWTLWVGPDASQLAVSREELVEQGVAEPVRTRADSAFVWAALASGAEVTLLDLDDVTLTDGIGAILRWTDLSTPHDRLPSMPGHGEGPGGPDH